MRFSFSSMRTVMNFITTSATRSRRSISFTVSALAVNCQQNVLPFVVLQHAVSKPPHAPFLSLVDGTTALRDDPFHLFDYRLHFFFCGIRSNDE